MTRGTSWARGAVIALSSALAVAGCGAGVKAPARPGSWGYVGLGASHGVKCAYGYEPYVGGPGGQVQVTLSAPLPAGVVPTGNVLVEMDEAGGPQRVLPFRLTAEGMANVNLPQFAGVVAVTVAGVRCG